jgi:FkbM family methyltransferase
MHRWLALGALRCRLFGGQRYLHPSLEHNSRNFRLPIGKLNQYVIVDISSPSELDTLEEILVDHVYPINRTEFTPAMVLDCGANVGYFASLARVRFPEAEIICWEPDDHNYSRLVSQPLLKTKQVKCYKSAVSDFDGQASLVGTGHGCMIDSSGKYDRQLIETINLSHWLNRNGRVPLLIKMDIEGHERRVLRALQDHWVSPCVLFLETHEDRGNDADILYDLTLAGFHIEHLRTHSLMTDTRVFKEYICRRV